MLYEVITLQTKLRKVGCPEGSSGSRSGALALLRDDPNAIHLYNRIGMVLRKMKDYDTAEKYYLKALTLTSTDEYLHYNLGRLYFDWRKWKKMASYNFV